MKNFLLTPLTHTLLFGSALSLSAGLIGCQDDPHSSQSSTQPPISSPVASNLGTLQGQLRLPQDQECLLFTAYQVGQEEPLFTIDIEQARVRDHRYSFLHALPEGEYHVKGVLSCVSEEGEVEYESLYDDVSILPDQLSEVVFRFFFDVESDLSQVDLKFCADLALRHLSPAQEACVGEEIQSHYDVEWLREDCGDVFLKLHLNEESYEGDGFTFPQEEASVRGYAPDEEGLYDLTLSLSSPQGGHIELYQSFLEVVNCEEDEGEGIGDGEGEEPQDRICDSEDTLDDLAHLDQVYSQVADSLYQLRELIVLSGSETLSEEERTDLQEELSQNLILLRGIALGSDSLNEAELDRPDFVDLECTFSDLNGLCATTERAFSQSIPSLFGVVRHVLSIDVDEIAVENHLSLVDEALLSNTRARNQLGALFVRFSTLMGELETESDLYAISYELLQYGRDVAFISLDETTSAEDRTLLNDLFEHFRDEAVRISACHSCESELEEDLPNCEQGSCLSIETQEEAAIAYSVVGDIADQFMMCLEEE